MRGVTGQKVTKILRPEKRIMPNTWRIAIISPNTAIAGELNGMVTRHLPSSQTIVLDQYPTRDEVQHVVQQRATLVILDAASDQQRSVEVISLFHSAASEMLVLAALDPSDPDYILRCLRQGAAEFVALPLQDDSFAQTIERIQKKMGEPASAAPGNRMIAVMPAKGACGATTVALALTHQWKKSSEKRFLMADLDPLSGIMSFLLKVKGQYSFLDVLNRPEELDADLWRGLVVNRNGIDILLSPDQVMRGLDALHDPNPILSYSRRAYDLIFLDTGGIYGDWNLNIAREADDVLLITTNELPALQAAQRCLMYLEKNRVARGKVKLVVNRYARELGLSREVISTALGVDVFATIPSDYETVQKAALEGKLSAIAGTNFGKGISELATGLGAAADQKKKEEKKGFFSFLRR
jgi:pilus assembly protein CpaE